MRAAPPSAVKFTYRSPPNRDMSSRLAAPMQRPVADRLHNAYGRGSSEGTATDDVRTPWSPPSPGSCPRPGDAHAAQRSRAAEPSVPAPQLEFPLLHPEAHPRMLRSGARATRSDLPELLGVEGGNVEGGQRLRAATRLGRRSYRFDGFQDRGSRIAGESGG